MTSTAKSIVALILFGVASCTNKESGWSPEGRKIASLAFRVNDEMKLDKSRIKTYVRSTPGIYYTAKGIDEDIRELYKSGLVDDIRVVVKPVASEVELVYEIIPRPRFRAPPFVGNSTYSDKRLAAELDFNFTDPVTLARLKSAPTRIESFYRSNGFPGATVTLKALDDGEPTEGDFVFVIEEDQSNAR